MIWRWRWLFYRRFPFVLPGVTGLYWCFFCQGWGDDPRGGYACPLCYGQGFSR